MLNFGCHLKDPLTLADSVACNISDILLGMTGLITDLQVKTMANEVAKCGIEYLFVSS